jgi:cytochrome c-type biogenesis protein CcmH
VTRLAALVAVVALGALGTAAVSAPAPSPADLEAELVCPTCKTTLDQSDAPVARRMKQIIRTRLAEGKTEQQIKDELVSQFGSGVLAEPPKSGLDLLAWLVPLAVLGAGALGVAAVAWGWSRRREEESAVAAVDPDLERRLDDELDAFDE